MRTPSNLKILSAIILFLLASRVSAQNSDQPAYLNPSLPAEQRAADLVHRMTIEEKVTQLVNQARAIPRLNIPAYDWWSESLHGVASNGTTEFPEPVGLASTFDIDAIHRMAQAIGIEGRIKHVQFERAGHSNVMEGLDFWAPNINIFRDPRWGRGQETYGEDPFLTARLGVAFVTGMQGDDPKYYRVISTPKHYAVHSGPEPTRHTADVKVSKHDELDTYLPAFRATVTEAKAASVMCAYNSVNGQPACVNEFLLQDQLRGKWNFQGYVVSDCGAIVNIFHDHQFTKTQPEASALAIQRGMDNECIDFAKVKDDHDYKPYLDAYQQGFLKESQIDTALIRLYTARMKLGMFDPPAMVPYTKIDEKELDSAEHRELARVLANESMVLLKNDGTLPLVKKNLKIAVVGPLADKSTYLLGNYTGRPTHTVSVLDGLKSEFPDANITFVSGTQFLRYEGDLVPASFLTAPDGQPGLTADFYLGEEFDPKSIVVATRRLNQIDLTAQDIPQEVSGKYPMRVQWTGFLTPTETGDYTVGIRMKSGFAKVLLDGKTVAQAWWSSPEDGSQLSAGHVHLEQGTKLALTVDYAQQSAGPIQAQLVWSKYDPKPSQEVVDSAKNADVAIAVLGITSELEGEEMPISEEGFKGGDRTSIDLPKAEEDLLEAVAATGKPVVLVLSNGSALSVNWAKEHVNAILESWYPGEEGGAAIAQTLSGKNNPAGRLPVTFYTGTDQLPPFEDYAMKGRTYRYFEGKPLYPFGYGLSYTTFSYRGLRFQKKVLAAGDPLDAELTVTNTGKREGDEVVQLYLNFPNVPGAPLRALRAFKRVHLKPGESQQVRFELKDRDLSMVSDAGEPIIAEGEYSASIGGGQPKTGAPAVAASFQIKGTKILPE
jgi:beta-glucosidase